MVNEDNVPLVLKAASFAAVRHKGHKRADGVTPYFSHVTRVAMILRHVFDLDDEEVLAAAFLHDTLEDTGTDYDEIAEVFGNVVADYVVGLTKNMLLPKARREQDYEQRLLAAPQAVRIAKLADLYDNLTDRVGSPKMAKTLETANRLTKAFTGTFDTDCGRGALQKVQSLIDRVSK